MVLTGKDATEPTLACLERHAAVRSDAVAVIDGGQSFSWARFADDVRRTVSALGRLGCKPGDIVAVEWGAFYRHWLLLLGLEALGAASFSFRGNAAGAWFEALLARAAFVIHGAEGAPSGTEGGARPVAADAAWWDAVDREPPARLPQVQDGDALVRIASGAGTTGEVLLIPQTAAQFDFRSGFYQRELDFNPESRFLLHMGFPMQADHQYAVTCLRAGGTCIHSNGTPVDRALAENRATHATLLPAHLPALLEDDGPADAVRGLVVAVVGGRVSGPVRDRLLSGPVRRVFETYATNETGPIAIMDPGGAGTVAPGVTVAIVDAEGDGLPPGSPGQIRLRSPGCVDGYLHDAAATGRMFRDGWFEPGDRGMLDADGRLRLLGRYDDVLNLRGMKLRAREYEDWLRGFPAVRDAALLVRPNEQGLDALWVGLVLEADVEGPSVIRAVARRLKRMAAQTFVFRLAAIPRRPDGAVDRERLNREIDRHPPPAGG